MGMDGKKDLTQSLLIGFFTVFILWFVKWIEIKLDVRFSELGIFPRTFSGLKGIFFSPFLHGDLSHLLNNSIPIFVLSVLLRYFYTPVFFRVLLLSVLIAGLGVWLFARPVFHIGASGVIYSLAGFIFLSGIIKKHQQLIAISLLVSFLYGGIVWGILPLTIIFTASQITVINNNLLSNCRRNLAPSTYLLR